MLLVISCCISQLLIMVRAKSVSAHPGQTWQVRTSALLPCASKTDSAEVSMAGRSGIGDSGPSGSKSQHGCLRPAGSNNTTPLLRNGLTLLSLSLPMDFFERCLCDSPDPTPKSGVSPSHFAAIEPGTSCLCNAAYGSPATRRTTNQL